MEIEKGKKGGLRNEVKTLKLLLNNKVDCQNLKPGDHIYAHHGLTLNSHHGIYAGREQVIHFISAKSKPKKGNPCQKCGHQKNDYHGVVKTCLDCFLSEGSHSFVNHSLRLYQYNVPTSWCTSKRAGSCSTSTSEPNDEVIDTATGFLTDSGFDYSLFYDDDESFAVYCKTGIPKSAGDNHSSETSKKKTRKRGHHSSGAAVEEEEEEEEEE